MPTKHAFTSGIADGGDATLVRPSNWNEIHVVPFDSGTFTLPTANGAMQVDNLTISGSEIVTLAGTSVLGII